MGVQDLNKLINSAEKVKSINRDYENIIIDASNLLFTLIYRSLSNLTSFDSIEFEKFTVKSNNRIFTPLNINDQLDKLTNLTIRDTNSIISQLLNNYSNIENIYLISDPITDIKYKYVYNDKIKMNCANKNLYDYWVKINNFKIDNPNDIEMEFSSKDDEKKLRVSRSKEPFIDIINNQTKECVIRIDNYDIFNPKSQLYRLPEDLSEKDTQEIEYIYKILYVTTYFVKKSNLFAMLLYFQSELNKLSESQKKLKYLTSNSEADIFIKAFYKNNLQDSKTLIISNDTDYFMLFAEYKNVDITKISSFNLSGIYNPYSFWTSNLNITNPNYLKHIMPRISALFGNDYTIHNRLIVSDLEFLKYICNLFQTDKFKLVLKSLEDDKIKKNTSIYKFVSSLNDVISVVEKINKSQVSSMTDLLNCIDLTVIKHVVKSGKFRYFNGYYETLLIYLNFEHYAKTFIPQKSLLEEGTEKYNLLMKSKLYDIDFTSGRPIINEINKFK